MFLHIFAQVKFYSRSNSLVGRHDVYQILGADVESAKNVTQLVEYLSSIHKTYPKWYYDSVILAWGGGRQEGQVLEDQKCKVILSYMEYWKLA